MAQLYLSFLGTFQIKLDDIPIIRFRSSKVQGMLVYLAMQSQRAVPRDVLATLFWPDETDSVARTNLRQTFYQLRKALQDKNNAERPFLLINRQTAQFNPQSDYILDAQSFHEALKEGDIATAVTHYHGDLLPGFTCDSLAFEAWLRLERERLHRQGMEALTQLAQEQLRQGAFAEALAAAQRQLAMEPWREAAHRQVMQALALVGDRSAALTQFDRCFEALEVELGVEPTDETIALYEQIATGVVAPDQVEEGLPHPPTSFVGRVAEVSHIVQTLNKPDCRILTLTGAGGIGKTRLAVQVAHTFGQHTGFPVYFTSLLGVLDTTQALAAIGRSLGVSLLDVRSAPRQIAAKLGKESSLLILDNAEPVLAHDGMVFGQLLNRISAKAASLHLLVTSRQPLQVRQEWTLPLHGLTRPVSAENLTAAQWDQYDAITLFQQRARQADVTFALSRHNIADVVQLCQLLDGSPLGIELAAAQSRQLAVSEILSAITQDISGLQTDLHDLPPRHRSLTAVFQQSWDLLNDEERQALRETAVFRGGFSRAAARVVLQDKADQLSSLVERSLLIRAWTPEGLTHVRYRQSPLLQAFLFEKHPLDPETCDRHATYYLHWAVHHPRKIGAEYANVVAAWAWAQSREPDIIPRRWNPDWLVEAEESEPQITTPEGVKTAVLVGRDRELAQIRQALRPVMEDRQNGGLITITGEAGIGKSYLIEQLWAETQTANWFDCPCDETMPQALHPFRHWLRHYFGQEALVQGDESIFSARLDDLVQATADDALQTELTQNRSFLAALVDLTLPDSPYMRLRPELRLAHFQQAIKALLKAESRLQPVILHVQDAHWLDNESHALLENILRHVADFPFAVIVSARPARFEPFGLLDLPQHTIRLESLATADVAQLAAHHLGHQPGDELVELLLERGGGNPFYTEQILLYLRENGLVVHGKLVRSGHYAGLDTLLPLDIHNLLVARLGQLEPAVHEVVAQAAVLGYEFSLTALRQIVADEAMQKGLAEGVQSAIWQPVSPDRYAFNHVLLRDAAYNTQFTERRRDLHRQAAQAITAVATPDQPQFAAIARHYDEADQSKKAIFNYLKAADEACDNYFIREAHNYYSRGLALAQNDKQRLRLYLGRELINYWLGNREQQQEDLRRLVALTAGSNDKALLADILLRRATFALATADYDTAVQHAKRACVLAAGIPNQLLEAGGYLRWGRALWQQGRGNAAEPLLKRALKLAQLAGDTALQATCFFDLSTITFYRSQFEVTRTRLQEAVALFEQMDDKHNIMRCVDALGQIAVNQAEYESALHYFNQNLRMCRSLDWPYMEIYSLAHLGDCYFELGDYEQCRKFHEQALLLAQSMGEQRAEAISLDTIGLAYQFEGNLAAARQRFEKALALHETLEYPRGKAFVQTHLGLVLANMEEPEQAGVYLYDALALRSEPAAKSVAVDTEAALAWLDLAKGDLAFALERVREITAWLADNGTVGVELPLYVYWQCYTILNMAGKEEAATAVLQQAYSLLQTWAERIKNDTLRDGYLNNVPYHRQIAAAWQAQFS